jgi:hypothetical protein
MDAQTAISGMVSASGKAPGELASAMGKGRTYVYSLLNHESVPRLDTFVRLARACGYRLVLETEDGSKGVELYSEVDEKQEDSAAVVDEADAILEKTVGRDGLKKMNADEWNEAISKTVPRALEAIRKREGMLFDDGDHRGDAYDTITTDVFSPWD